MFVRIWKRLNEGGFADPFPGMVGDKFTSDTQLANAIRLDIAAELEAIHLYQAHAEATDDKKVKEVLNSIADEERVHVGELQNLLKYLQPNEGQLLDKGEKEAEGNVHKTTEQG